MSSVERGTSWDVAHSSTADAIFTLHAGIAPASQHLVNTSNDLPPPSVMVDITDKTDAVAAMISEKLLNPWLTGKVYFVS